MTYSQVSTRASHGSRTITETELRFPHSAPQLADASPAQALQLRRDAIKDRKAESVRAAVAEHALALLLASGFDATTVDDIAKISGVGRRTFFRYFETKEAVVLWHLEQFGSLAARLTAARPDTESPLEAVQRALLEASHFFSRAPERTRDILRMVESTPSLYAQYVVQCERFKLQIAAALAVRSQAAHDDLSSLMVGRVALEALATGIRRWLHNESVELSQAVEEAFQTLRITLS